MIELDAKFNTNNISNMLKEVKRELKKVPQEAYDFFLKQTPKKTGNARSKTKLRGSVIQADYQYAEVLDKGRHMTSRGMRGSDQAPQGMTKPTEKFIQDRVDKIFRGK
jgi:hypothetical protein